MVTWKACDVDNQPGISTALGSRAPDLNEKNCVLFKFPILPTFYWPCPSLLWFYSEFLALKSPLDTQSRSLSRFEPSLLEISSFGPKLRPKGSQISASEETQVPDPGPPCQATPGPKGVWSRGLGSHRSAATLLPRDDLSRRKRMETFVSSAAREKSTDEARDGHE